MIRLFYNIMGLLTAHVLYPYAEKKLGRAILPKLSVLRQEAALPFAQRKRLALDRLIKTLEHAGQTVPYYQELFAACRFRPDSVRTDFRYFEDLPYLTKEIIHEQGLRMKSKASTGPLHERKTGSSTGPATLIYYEQEGLDWTAAQNIQMLEWAGKRRHFREAHLSTRFLQPLSPQAVRDEARKCFVLHRRNIYTDGHDAAAMHALWTDLREARALFVQGHPSSLDALARHVESKGGLSTPLFDVFVSTGEMLTESQRGRIERVLHCRVSNRYGACEFGVMAQELLQGPHEDLLVADSLVWPEVADISTDGLGELVFTGLRNRAMPLIRYRMGDMGRLEERANGWWLTALAGRIHDVVAIEGVPHPTHYVQDILDRCGPISDFQIAVKNGTAKELRLVCAPKDWETIAAAVQANFPSLALRRITVEELVFVGMRGKFRYVISID